MIKMETSMAYIFCHNFKKPHKDSNLDFDLKYRLLFMSSKHFPHILPFCYVVMRWVMSAGRRKQSEEINIKFLMVEPGSFSH